MLERFRFVVSPRWLGLTAAAVVVVAVCGLLSQWQWGRAEQRAEANDRIEAAGEPVDLDEVVPAGGALADEDRWTLVEATGTFDADGEIVLRAQTNNSVNGFEVVTPLVLADGTALLVDRGFVAGEGSGAVPDYPAPPAGAVTVVGRVYESEPSGGAVTVVDDRLQARRLNLDRLGEHLDYELRGAWIGQTAPADGFTALEEPSFRSWQNYSYAVQWALFAALVPIGWVVLLRRELRGTPEDEAVRSPRSGSSSTAA
ncbi:SURF1 family protein [Glycomyces halotolerans]